MSEHVIVEVVIAAPYERVWDALRDGEQIANWHGWDAPTQADEIDEIYAQGATADADAGTIDFGGVETRFALSRRGDETVLRVTKPGPAEGETWDDGYFDEIDQGWITFVHQLRFWLERHAGVGRRTLHLVVPDAAGFVALGPPAFRTRHQTGVLVEDWGPGLVVVHHHPDGGARVIVNTYGLSGEQFAAVEAACAARAAS